MTTCSHTNDINTSIKNPTSRLAYMMAKIILSFNIPINQWIEQLKFHMVILAQSNNPKHNTIELAAMTGLDRRYVTKTLKTGEIKRTNSKIDKVLEKIRQICLYKHTDTIQIYGKRNTFASTCKTISSTSLSTKAIASELIRRGDIIEMNNTYKITNLSVEPIEDSIIYKKEMVEILAEVKRVCKVTQSNCIAKHGTKNSLQNICKMFQSGLFNPYTVIKDLISRNSIVDLGDKYLINDTNYIIRQVNNKDYIDTMSVHLLQHTNTMLNNKDAVESYITHYQMRIYSTQINPKLFETVKCKIVKSLRKAYLEVEELLEQHEEQVPFFTYPQTGACFYGFDDLKMINN